MPSCSCARRHAENCGGSAVAVHRVGVQVLDKVVDVPVAGHVGMLGEVVDVPVVVQRQVRGRVSAGNCGGSAVAVL